MNKDSDKLMSQIASSINGLILNKNLDVALYNALRNVGECLETSVCYIFINEQKKGGDISVSKYKWAAPHIHVYPESEKPIKHKTIAEKILVLGQNRIFEAKCSDVYKLTRSKRYQGQIISLITFPIFVHEEFWGFLEVRDHDPEREWNNSEKNILQIITTSIGGAIERRNLEENLERKVLERTEELRKNKTYLSLAIEAFDLGMWIYDVKKQVIKFNLRQAEIYELEEIGEPDDNGLYELDDVQVFIKKWAPDHVDLSEDVYEDIIAGKRPYLIERKLITKRGAHKYIMSKGVGFLDDFGTKLIGLTVDLTERKLEELELRKSNTKYSLATKATSMGIWDWNIMGDILEWDEGMFEIYDITEEEFTGKVCDWEKSVLEDDRAFTAEQVRLAMDGSKELEMEFRIKTRSGGIRYIRSCGNVYRDDKGQATRLIGLNWDITVQKEADIALRASEEEFRNLYNQTPTMLHSVDSHGKLISVSDYWLEHLGYEREKIIGTKYTDYLTPTSREFAISDRLPSFLEAGIARNVPYEFLNARGETIHVLLSAISQKDENGEFTHSLAVLTDITERVMAERALRNSLKKFESLINNIPGIVYTAEYPSFNMSFASDYCEKVTGYTQNQLHNRNQNLYVSLVHREDVLERDDFIQKCLKQKKPFRIQYRLLAKTGKIRWVSEYGHGLYDERGELIEIEGSIFDITDKVKSEEKVLSAVMQAADRERSRISAEIHDSLQQTLTIAALNFEYVGKNENCFTKKTREKYLIALAYLRKSLDQTRVIAHRLMPKAIEDFGFIEVINDVVVELNRTTNTKFNFLTNETGFCFPVMIEATLYKITQEAINNIIKHAKAKQVTIQFLFYDDGAQLSIEDDGKGFSLTDIDMDISGFGIASMKNRVTALHGSFHVDTTPGRGTSVFIYIPIEQTQE